MTITVIHHSPVNRLLMTLLKMHQEDKNLTPEFIQENGSVLQQIFKSGWGSYSVTRMMTGRYMARRHHKGLLTPPGLVVAKEISQHS